MYRRAAAAALTTTIALISAAVPAHSRRDRQPGHNDVPNSVAWKSN